MRKRVKSVEREDSVKMNRMHKKVLIVMCVVFSVYSLTLIFPFLWLFVNSLKTRPDFLNNSPFSFPSVGNWEWGNYVEMFQVFPLVEMFFNSLVLSLVCPTVAVFATICAGYIVAKFVFPGKRIVYFIGLMVMFVTVSGSLVSKIRLLNALGLMDTLMAMILLTSSAFGFNFLLVTGTFQGVSNTYREAAMLDGAGEWRIFIQIYFPQIMPTVTAVWILQFIGQWNDYGGAYLYYNSHPTLATGIKEISDSIESAGEYQLDYPKMFACMVITIIPIIALFAGFQKQIMRLNMGGGIKG